MVWWDGWGQILSTTLPVVELECVFNDGPSCLELQNKQVPVTVEVSTQSDDQVSSDS